MVQTKTRASRSSLLSLEILSVHAAAHRYGGAPFDFSVDPFSNRTQGAAYVLKDGTDCLGIGD
jgi:hypothetical protein